MPEAGSADEEKPKEESSEPAENIDGRGEPVPINVPDAAADERAANEAVSRMRFDCFQNLSELPPPPPPPPMSTLDRSAPRPALRTPADRLADRALCDCCAGCGDCRDTLPLVTSRPSTPPKSRSFRSRLAAAAAAATGNVAARVADWS